MANSDSRHTTPFPRWGESAAQVVDAGTVEPSGGKKDTGWSIGDVPNRSWWNWLHYAAGAFFRYIENSRALMWTKNHVMAGAASSEGAVTSGVGLSVDVTSARVWISGQMQLVPAVANLALAARDATQSRYDLVTAKVVGLAPVYATVTGTPGTPPVEPAVPAGELALCAVLVLSTAAGGGQFLSDRREFGAIDLSTVRASKRFLAGQASSGNFAVMEVVNDFVYLGGIDDPQMSIDASNNTIIVRADAFQYSAPLTRKFDIHSSGMKAGPGAVINNSGWTLSDTAEIYAPVMIPDGCMLVAFRVYGDKSVTTAGVTITLKSVHKTSLVFTELGLDPAANNAGDPIGPFMIEDAVVPVHFVDQDNFYFVEVVGVGAGFSSIFGVEVEYTEVKPFNAL